MTAAPIELLQLAVGAYQSNSYLVVDRSRGQAILVDAGAEAKKLLTWCAPFEVTHILITHGHSDHIGALEEVQRSLAVPVGLNPVDARGFQLAYDLSIEQGVHVPLGKASLEVVEIPGHTPGSVALYLSTETGRPWALVGDAIFPGGPGHTSSPEALRTALEALAQTVFTWPDPVILYPGHGEATTVGAERGAFNTFRRRALPPDLYGDVTWR